MVLIKGQSDCVYWLYASVTIRKRSFVFIFDKRKIELITYRGWSQIILGWTLDQFAPGVSRFHLTFVN